MMKLHTVVVTLAACMTVAVSALGGTTGKIAGVVKDAQSKEPVVGASIVLEGTRLGAATNIEGYYVILNVPPGKYTLVLSSVGYNKKTIASVSVSVDLTTTQDVELVPESVLAEEVVVVAERPVVKKDLTSSESRVDANTISSLPVSEVNEVLALQAGVTVDRGGGIHIRGGRSNEVAYWVDGVSVSDVYDGGRAVQVNNNGIQELQVISGTFNAEYGQAMSGIVNIVTKDGDQKLRGNLNVYSGDYVSGGKELFYNIDKLNWLANKNVEGSLSGPIPGTDAVTFYVSGRYFKTDGWLYGNRTFDINGRPLVQITPHFNSAGELSSITPAPNPAPMNWRESYSGQGKVTLAAGPLKLNLSGIGSKTTYRDYNQDWKYVPDGDVTKYDRGYTLSALITHTLSSSSFYTLNLSFFSKNFREYLFEDPLDVRQIVDTTTLARPAYMYNPWGTNNHHFKRITETRVAKFDYTDQVSKLHELKIGFEGRLHRLYLEDFNTTYDNTLFTTTGQVVRMIPDRDGPLYEEYTRKPIEFSAYAQDKLEYESMIVNIGVRFDYFNSKAQILTNPHDPNVFNPALDSNQAKTLDQRLGYWYKDAKAKYLVSPRFGISYPITDRGILHFSYGWFLQIPSFQYLYQKPGFKVTSASGVQGVYGNADLNPQKTVMYELGLQQQLSNDLSFDVTGFYRDVRDWVTTTTIPVRDPNTATTFYSQYVNRDYANVRGITLSANKRPGGNWMMNFSYTFQTAEGNNSNPEDEAAAQAGGAEPTRTLTPLNWDQTHTVNLSVGYGPPDDWGIFLIGQYGSGLPYTPAINQADPRGQDAARGVKNNSRRRPETYTVDLRAFKNFVIGDLSFSFYTKIFNLLDTRNELDVYAQTGRATATPAQLGIGSITGGNRLNTVEQYLQRPEFYSEPRQIQFGIEMNF
jgi:outer membrane receptor protein involved in Fe transport